MRKRLLSHFFLFSLIQAFFSITSWANNGQVYADTSRMSEEMFFAESVILYDPVCASNGRTYLNAKAAGADGATDLESGHCSTYESVFCQQPSRQWISEVWVNGMSEKSGSEGYRKATNVIFDFYKHDSNIISLYRQPASGVGIQQWKVWIDFDGDMLFEEEEAVVDVVTSDFAMPVFIPNDVEIGTLTRMRVFMGERGENLESNVILWGEVEDYTVQVSR